MGSFKLGFAVEGRIGNIYMCHLNGYIWRGCVGVCVVVAECIVLIDGVE